MTLIIAMIVLLTTEIVSAQGFNSVTSLSSLSVSTTTGEKPQSKLWTYAGKWWMVMSNSTATFVWRLDGTSWTSVLNISSATNIHADCKLVGGVTHILLFNGTTAASLVSVEYVPASNTYQLWTARTTPASITLEASVETATIDIDGTGRMWLASDGTTSTYVRYSDSPYSSWSSPITMASNIIDDDISAVIAFSGKIGVFWSNQNTKRFGFRIHVDGADPSVWSTDEVPAWQSAIDNVGTGMADDHMNLKVATDGTIYAAVKTGWDTPGYPKMALLVRRPAGTWDNLYGISESGTRPIVVLNEALGKLKFIYSSSEGNNPSVYNESPMSTISFGPQQTLISSSNNDVTSTKQNYSPSVVIVASNGSSLSGVLASDILPNTFALDFDGATTSADYVNCTNNSAADITGSITMEAWVNPDVIGTQSIVKKNGSNSGYELSLATNTGVPATDQKYFFRLNGNDSYRINSTSTYPIDGTWTHIAATYDGSVNRIYVNGVEQGSPVAVPVSIVVNANNLVIGTDALTPGTGKNFNGGIDEVRIWNVARTPQEILENYDKAITSAAGLVGRWGMNEGTGTTTANSASVVLNGTLVNGPLWIAGLQLPLAAVPAVPNLSSPSNNATNVALNPTLVWNVSAGSSSYRVQVSTVSNFSSTVYNQGGITTASTTVTGLTSSTVYYWRVNSTNSTGTCEWSTVWSFTTIASGLPPTAPTLATPLNNAINIPVGPTLTWNAASGATTYRVQVSTLSDFSTTVYDQSGITSTSASVTGLLVNTVYYWRVNATNATGTSDWSTVWSFTTSGFALTFDGTNDFVTFGAATSTLGALTFTIECWFNWTGGGVTTSTGSGGLTTVIPLVTKGRGEADGSNLDMNYFLGIQGGKLAADFEDIDGATIDGDAAGQNQPIVGILTVTANVWHHAAATFNGTIWKLYLDGVFDSQIDVTNPGYSPPRPQYNSIQHAGLGTAMTSAGAAAGYFAGIIDEVRIWNVARTQQQIQNNISLELTSGTGLLGRWGINEGTGTTASNSVAESPSGTLTNGPTWTPPGAPFNLTFTPPADPSGLTCIPITCGQINLSWADNSNNETNFQIERSVTGIGGTYTLLATVATNTVTFSDLNLTPSNEYCYRVRAINGVGNSNWAGPTCVTTPAEGQKGLSFNGSNQYATSGVTLSTSPLNTSTYTIETWFRRDGAGVGVTTGGSGITSVIPLVTKGTSEGENASADINYFLGINASGNVLCADFEEAQSGASPSLNHPISGTTAIVNGTWYHAAATYDGNKWQLFLNGILEAELVVGRPANTAVISPFAMGTSIQSNGTTIQGYLNGALDEVRVWNYARTQSEIRSTINSQLSSLQTGLLGRWGLNEGTGTTANNLVPSSPYVTLVNTPSWITPGAPFNLTFTPPAAPTNITTTLSAPTSIQLNWTDNSGNETGFEIHRSTTGSNGIFTLLTTVAANVVTYTNTGLTALSNFCYKISAINSAGSSGYSNTACESTPTAITFQDGTNSYTGTRDTYTNSLSPTVAHGSDIVIIQDINTGDDRRSMLLFDLSSIPSGATIESVQLQFYVDVEGEGFNMHRMLVPWDEATVTYASLGNRHFAADGIDAETSVNTNWPGNAGYTGFITVSVPASTIQDWINGTLTNNGWLMIATDPLPDGNGQQLRSRETATPGDRPKLTVNYYPPVVPTISITSIPLSPFSNEPGIPSAEQNYMVSGINLTADIVITAPTDFQVSTTSGSGFSSSVTLTQSGGIVAATPIYVRFNRPLPGTSSGNIVHTSDGATTQNITVSGTTAAQATRTFQEGVNGYNGTSDTHLQQTEPDASHAAMDYFKWDTESGGGIMYGLLRFDNIFGSNPGQIPTDAVIQSATLTYNVYDVGDYANIYEVNVDWNEDVTYNNFGGEAGVQADEYGNLITTAPGNPTGTYSINAKSSIINWLSNPSANKGWLFYPTNTDGVQVRSSEYLTSISLRPKLTVTYLVNPPDQPVLVAPIDNSINVSTSPQLSVTVSDPENQDITVRFYGRQVASLPPVPDFTIVALPDAQKYTAVLNGGTMAMFNAQTNWCVSELASRNIAYVVMEGDITNDNNLAQWDNAVTAMNILENYSTTGLTDGIPYGISIGNHDGAPDNTALYNDKFGVSRFNGRSYYGGYYGSDNNNNYALFSASGIDFIVINLGSGSATPTADVLNWANTLMQNNLNRRAIVASHHLLSGNNWDGPGQTIYDALKGNPNLFLMLCGHTSIETMRTDTYGGNTVYTILTDYQNLTNGGSGWLRILTFSPLNNKITVSSHSPYLNQSNYSAPFDLDYNMSPTNDFVLLGTNTGVTSGSTTSIIWPDRLNNTEYEWYVEVSNGESAIIGPTWSFTTAAATTTAITTGTITGSQFCAGASLSVPYSITGTFNSGNIFTAQLSDASGSFTSPVSIGTFTGTTSGTIAATIPIGASSGTEYRVRVTGSNPVTIGSNNGADITINALPETPVVGTITQPTCSTATGSADLSDLPAGNWTLTATPGGATQTGSGTTATFTGLPASTSYTFTVTLTSSGCISAESENVVINAQPVTPAITNPGAQTACDSYTLSTIAGTNLVAPAYYNNSQVLGGTVITGPITSTQTVWIYDANGICSDEESFLVTINASTSVSGYFNYSNAGTPLNGVSIELQQEGDPVYNTSTDADGHFTFLNVCPGTYDVVASSTKTTGGINVTDAAQTNYWGVFHGGIEKVRFLAGDVNGDDNVASADASNILQYFLTQGNPDPAFASQWSFWKTGDQLITNNPPGPLGYPTITVAGSNVTQNLYGLVTGDFNQSFVPGSTKAVSESLTLIYGETIDVIPDMEFDLPLSAAVDMEVGAVSLILDFPSDLMEVNGVYLTDDPNTPVMYEVSGDELRIGWNSIEPVSLMEGENLLTLRVKVIGSTGEEGIRFKLAADPLNELADGNYEVISNAVLSIDIVKTVTTGTGEISLSERLTLSNHPNPFKGTTNFVYTLPADGKVTLEIYDIVGNKVKSLVDETQQAGDYVLPMDDAVLLPGVYTATLRLNNSGNVITRTIKLISKK